MNFGPLWLSLHWNLPTMIEEVAWRNHSKATLEAGAFWLKRAVIYNRTGANTDT